MSDTKPVLYQQDKTIIENDLIVQSCIVVKENRSKIMSELNARPIYIQLIRSSAIWTIHDSNLVIIH